MFIVKCSNCGREQEWKAGIAYTAFFMLVTVSNLVFCVFMFSSANRQFGACNRIA
jgi:uncharacterized protein (DUF983 family)